MYSRPSNRWTHPIPSRPLTDCIIVSFCVNLLSDAYFPGQTRRKHRQVLIPPSCRLSVTSSLPLSITLARYPPFIIVSRFLFCKSGTLPFQNFLNDIPFVWFFPVFYHNLISRPYSFTTGNTKQQFTAFLSSVILYHYQFMEVVYENFFRLSQNARPGRYRLR